MNKTRGMTVEGVPGGVRPARFIRRAIPSLGALALFFASGSASAQAWLSDRAAAEGAGVRAGDFEFHPGIGIQAGYDSNYFLRTDKTGTAITNGGVVGTPELAITPSISLATLGPQRSAGTPEQPSVTFRASASGTYREFFGQLTPEQRNGSIDASANLGILPGRSWGAALSVNYDRVIQPATSGDPDFAFTRDMIAGSAEIIAQPGGGTLDWHLGGTASTSLFEDSGGTPYNNASFGLFTRGRWKFRPKTALVYDATLGFTSYSNSDTAGAGTIAPLHSSDPVRTRIGINGLLTPRLSLLAMAGYGGSFFQPGSSAQVAQYDSVIGQAELKYYLTALADTGVPGAVSLSQSSIAVGYTRDFQSSYLSDFSGLDRGYLKFSYFFAGRFLVTLEGGVGAVEYPRIVIPSAGDVVAPFTDLRADALLYSEYRFTDYFALTGTLHYTTNVSSEVINIGTAAVPENYAMQWQRFEAYLGVRLFL